jgi:hypothetical protein
MIHDIDKIAEDIVDDRLVSMANNLSESWAKDWELAISGRVADSVIDDALPDLWEFKRGPEDVD